MNKRFSRADLFLLTGWLALLVLLMAHSTLALPYFSDDFEHAQLIAQIRAGLEPWRDLIVLPFHGQTLVLLRLLFWFGTFAGNMSLTWVRLGVCAAHIAGAVGCAILCARWTGSKLAGCFAGTLYAGALGSIGEQIWWPSSAIFCLGVTFLIFAAVALNPDAKNRNLALGLSLLMLTLAALGLNGILVAALAIPIFLRRRDALVFLAVIAALLIVVLLRHDQEQVKLSLRGLGLGGWLVVTAPFRFFSAFTFFAFPGFQTIWKLAPIAWLPLLASLWFTNARQRRILLAVWTPAILLALLTGLARADYPFRFGPGSLYTADRYYYVFLFPLVTHCILFASTFKLPRSAIAFLMILTALALAASHARYLANVPRATFAAAGHALERGRLLVEAIRSSPTLPLDGARYNSLTLAFLIYSQYPRGIPGVQFVQQPLPASQAVLENSFLSGWTARPQSRIDFKDASFEQTLTSGFSWWDKPFRWMSGTGSLHLIAAPGDLVISAYAPVDQLHRAIHVSIAINGQSAGTFAITSAGLHEYRLQPPAMTPGSTANITLISDFVWHARDILPQSLDDRDLSIAVSAIGFSVRP